MKKRKDQKKTPAGQRNEKGRFQPGNKLGKRFGDGQPVDHGGRPPMTVRGMAREIGGERVKLNDGKAVPILHQIVQNVANAALGEDKSAIHAAEVFAKWHGVDEVDEQLDRLKTGQIIGADVTVDPRQFPEGV